MPNPYQLLDGQELTAVFDDHVEHVYLGEWNVLVIGQVKLVRHDDGTIEAEQVEDCFEMV
jgi:hypothetical protein